MKRRFIIPLVITFIINILGLIINIILYNLNKDIIVLGLQGFVTDATIKSGFGIDVVSNAFIVPGQDANHINMSFNLLNFISCIIIIYIIVILISMLVRKIKRKN